MSRFSEPQLRGSIPFLSSFASKRASGSSPILSSLEESEHLEPQSTWSPRAPARCGGTPVQRAGFSNPRTAPPERQRSSNSFKQIAGGRNIDASSGGADGIGGSVVAAVSRCNYGSSSLLHQQLHQDVGAVNTAANYCSLRWSNLNKARLPSAQAGLMGERSKYAILFSIPLQIFIKMQRFCNKRTSRSEPTLLFHP